MSGRVEVDGHWLECPDGETILAAALRAGSDIPTVCWLPEHPPDGGCRVCVVEVEGFPHLLGACHTPVRDGMRIRTQTPALERTRAALRELAEAATHPGISDTSHPYLKLDLGRCILCRRCLHVCEDVQGANVYGVVGRGAAARLALGSDDRFETSPCTSCGACIEVCPTGALSDCDPKPEAAAAHIRSTCGYCGVGCQISVQTRGGSVQRIDGVARAEVNRGHLCAKGRFAHGWRESDERLTQPLLRRAGRLERVSWREALAFAATRLAELHAAHGPVALGALSSSRSTNEAAYLLQKLFRTRFGTNNVDCCARVCHASTAAALYESTGTGAASACYDDIERARLIAVVGANPTEAHPVLGARIAAAVRRGARLLVIDPRRIELADGADVWLRLRPGTNVALLNALAARLLELGACDFADIERRVDGLAELRAELLPSQLEAAAGTTGVSPGEIARAAELIAECGPTLFVTGLGTSELTQGTASVLAISNLALLTGSFGRVGAGLLPLRGQNNVQGNADMGASPDFLTGYRPVASSEARAELAALWRGPLPEQPGQTLPELLESAASGSLRALWIQGEDLAQTEPDQTRIIAALERLELVVVQELFPTETTRLAHLVLPSAGYLEQDGTFTNAERRIQRVRAAAAPPGEARPDWEVIRDLAHLLGCDWPLQSPGEVMAEVARAAPALFGGVSYDRLERDGLQWPCPEATHPGTARLHTAGFPRGRARLIAVSHQPSPEERVDFPYRLTTGRVLQHYNAGSMTRRTPNAALAPNDWLEIHPRDAEREGVRDGDELEVQSRWGSCRARVRVSTRVGPATLFLSFHFPETHANRVTGAQRDPQSHCPELKLTAVRLRR